MNYISKTVERERQREGERSLVAAKTQYRDDEVMHCELQKQYGERSFISRWGKKARQIQIGENKYENKSNKYENDKR